MKLTFLGAAKTVTGSCILVEADGSKLLVDCGMFQGYSKENMLNERAFPFNPREIDFILLTHAHIDHSGRIPKIYNDGFRGKVIATKATVELCAIMLPDSGHIQEFEIEWLNRKRMRRGKPPLKPLYTSEDAQMCLELFEGVPYGEIIRLGENIKVKFNDAGHMLGSSIIELWAKERGEEIKVVFSGDIGNKDMPIIKDPANIENADFLVIESTYGNRVHNDNKDKIGKFVNIVNETIKKGGNVIIPSFAVGRTQEIIYGLRKQKDLNNGVINELLLTPVFVDSPLAVSATEVFRRNLDCFDEEAREYIRNGENPLDFPGLKFTRSVEESKALNQMPGSVIIISASGMCEAGRIKHHLKHNLWRKECTVLFVGYQAEGTLGRKLLDGAKKVKIFGEEISVNARIEIIDGFSGHADREGLLDWLNAFAEKPDKIFIVHGEEDAMTDFSEYIRERFGGTETIIPSLMSSYYLSRSKAVQKAEIDLSIEQDYGFARLQVLDYMDRIKDELEEMTEILKADLKAGVDDKTVGLISGRLKDIEKAILETLKQAAS